MGLDSFVQWVTADRELKTRYRAATSGKELAVLREQLRNARELPRAAFERAIGPRVAQIMRDAVAHIQRIDGARARVKRVEGGTVLLYEPWHGFGTCGLCIKSGTSSGEHFVVAQESMWRGTRPSEGFCERVRFEDATRKRLVRVVTDWLVSAYESAIIGD